VQASPPSGGLSFIKNQGQWDSRAQYLASIGGGDVWLTKQGYVLDVHQQTDTTVKGQVVRVSFSGGNSAYADGEQLPGKMNYFVGNVPSKWATNVPRFAGATAQHMLSGLDVRYYFDQGSPRYDLILAPGGDPSSIAMNFEGANGLNVLRSGNLQIETSLGPIEERGLVAYQQQGSVRVSVPCQMVVTGSTVHFRLADYDKSKPLIIDPLLFCTYWTSSDAAGGYVDVQSNSLSSDATGNLITVGTTTMPNFPTTTGAYQTSNHSYFGGGYVSKLSADGRQLVFGSYLSGTALNAGDTDGDAVMAVTTDAAGAIFMTGRARSSDFPITGGAVQSKKGDPNDGYSNAFIAEMTPDGTHLTFSTYYGGSQFQSTTDKLGDLGTSIEIDSKGNVLVAGHARSTDFPVTVGSYQTVPNPNDTSRAFVAKFNGTGTGLLFATLVSGAALDYNSNYPHLPNLALDASDNVYLGGEADAVYYKPSSNSWNVLEGIGYISKFSSDGKKQIFGVLVGGPVTSIAATPTGGVAFLSQQIPSSATWPNKYNTAGTYHFPQTSYKGFCVGQFTSDGNLLRGTLADSLPTTLQCDKAGNVYLFGEATGLPTTSDAYQQSPGTYYLVELSPEQDKLLYGSYFTNAQGQVSTAATMAMVGINRFAILSAATQSGVPITAGAYNTTGGREFLALLSIPIYAHIELTPNPVVGGQSVTGKVTLPAVVPQDAVVSLSSGDAGVKVPATVTIPHGTAFQTFTATTAGVAANTVTTISAKYGVGTGTAQLTRMPASISTLTLSAASTYAGGTVTGTVTLNGLAGPGGDLIQLSSSNANATVPASAVIYNGSGLATFQIKTAAAAASYTSQITAKFGAVSKTVQIEVDPGLSSLTVSPASVVAGATAQGVVKFSGKAASAATVSLSSSASAASVPSSVMVPAGATLVAFSITTSGVNVATTVTITAKEGSLTQTGTLTVTPAVLSFFTLNPTSVKGGTGVQGIVRLNGPAGSSGVTVGLSSPSTLATVPASVFIAPGASYFVFAIGTKPVSQTTTVNRKATSGAALTATLTITH
jgi:hypothetical protein